MDGRFDSFKSFVRRVLKKLLWYSYFGVTGFLIFQAGGAFNPSVHFVQAEKELEAQAPVMERILDCESGNGKKGTAKHFDSNGQVLMRANTNGSVDVGIAQINSVNFAEATKMGFDITKEEDNRAFAEYLFRVRGSEPWYSSKHCWNK